MGAACFYSLIRKEQTAKQDLLLLFADSFVYAVAGYAILGDVLGDYPGALLSLSPLPSPGWVTPSARWFRKMLPCSEPLPDWRCSSSRS
jgi:hypothetical protein